MQAAFRYYNRKYIFPAQFATCVAGNTLNLIVLSGRNMRTKTNCFLTAMAMADLAFFVAMLLPNMDYVGGAAWLQKEYFFLHIPFVACANWFSAASIWLTVAVTLERLIATTPHQVATVCRIWNRRRTLFIVGLIYASTLILSLYHFAWRKVKQVRGNVTSNATNSSTRYKPAYTWESVMEKNEPVTYWYVQSSHLLFGLLVVIGPLLTVFVLNCIIVCRLRSHSRHVTGNLFPGSETSVAVLERIRRRERRVTLTIVLLVSVFIVFNVPSGIFSVIEFLATKYVKVVAIKRWYWDLGETCNALVCTGKAINFWLYCSASSDYRRELRNVLTCRRCRKANCRSDDVERSRSTSRISSNVGLRHRQCMSANRRITETCSHRRTTGMTTLL